MLGTYFISAQESGFVIPDSLENYSSDNLFNAYLKVRRDTVKSKIYLYSLLEKATADRDTTKMADAYNYLSSFTVKESEKIALLDKSITISKSLNHEMYPTRAYSFKGGYYFKKGDFQLALDNYIKALVLAEKFNNIEYLQATNHNIACIKTRIGKHNEALALFKENFEHEKNRQVLDELNYLKSLLPLAESYRYNKHLDSASIYNQKGIVISLKNQNLENRFYGKLVFNQGINLFFKGAYNQASDSLVKGMTLLDKTDSENRENYILGTFYLGKLSLVRGDTLLAEKQFISMDSIIQKEKITFSEVREGYEFLISLNKIKEEKELQLTYVNKLLRFDSIISEQRESLSTRLFKEFDTPLLLKEKETLIRKLKKNTSTLSFWVVFLIMLSVITTIFMYYQYINRKKYQQKFNDLLERGKNISVVQKKPLDDIGIANEIVTDILDKLSLFEENHQYLKKNISIATLAKEIHTNTKYLSKVINHHKNKSFTNYINELRVQYSVEKLKESDMLKNYTIQGIAEEMGFNSAESFSSAFKKSTGIKPSYFVRKLSTLETN